MWRDSISNLNRKGGADVEGAKEVEEEEVEEGSRWVAEGLRWEVGGIGNKDAKGE